MSGAIALDGDLTDQARHRLAVMIGFLSGVKNVPVSEETCTAIAAEVTPQLSAKDLFVILHGEPDEELRARIMRLADNTLDWIGAARMVRIFAGLDLPDDDVNRLLHKLIDNFTDKSTLDVLGDDPNEFLRQVIGKLAERARLDALGDDADRFLHEVISKIVDSRKKARSDDDRLRSMSWPASEWVDAQAIRCFGPERRFKHRRVFEAAILFVTESELAR